LLDLLCDCIVVYCIPYPCLDYCNDAN
jgi:hypothetical protein